MTTHYLSDAISLASIKAQKEERRYGIVETRAAIYKLVPLRINEESDIYIEPDGMIVKKGQENRQMMIWNQDGVRIYDVVQANFLANVELRVNGLAEYNGTPIEWKAVVKPSGWSVSLENVFTHRVASVDGVTFNLPLEISAAIRNNSGLW